MHLLLYSYHRDVCCDVSMSSTSASSSKSETTDKDEGKTAGDDAPPVNIGWNSHQEVVRTRYVYIYIYHLIIYIDYT